jgi:hypothetical protein
VEVETRHKVQVEQHIFYNIYILKELKIEQEINCNYKYRTWVVILMLILHVKIHVI